MSKKMGGDFFIEENDILPKISSLYQISKFYFKHKEL